MNRADLLAFLRSHKYAVQTSVGAGGQPQAAVVGIAVSDAFELVFDTLETTRKARNLAINPRIAFVIGGDDGDERSVQFEGLAERPAGAQLEAARALYFRRFPDGQDRLAWPGLIHLLVRPTWLRYSDYNRNPPEILEYGSEALRTLR